LLFDQLSREARRIRGAAFAANGFTRSAWKRCRVGTEIVGQRVSMPLAGLQSREADGSHRLRPTSIACVDILAM
jgi:hypothetical protein